MLGSVFLSTNSGKQATSQILPLLFPTTGLCVGVGKELGARKTFHINLRVIMLPRTPVCTVDFSAGNCGSRHFSLCSSHLLLPGAEGITLVTVKNVVKIKSV